MKLKKITSHLPKTDRAKECSNYCTTAFVSHASKVMLKTLQGKLQQYVNRELPDVQAGFRKGRGTKEQTVNICWIIEKAREFQKKTPTSASLTMLKPLLCGSQQAVENSSRGGTSYLTRPPYLPPEKPVRRSRSNS